MAGTVGQAIGTALIPETMARFQAPGLIEQAQRKQQVGDIQGRRLLGGMDAEIGTPETRAYQVNGRTIGQNNPSTVKPLFSPAKKMALFSEAFPEQGRALMAQQIQKAIAPPPLTKDDFVGTPGEGGVMNIRTQGIVPGTRLPKASAPYSDIGKLTGDYRNGLIDEKTYLQEVQRLSAPRQEETWNNPISEVGPGGKPVQVQYGNRGSRRVVEGATPSRQGNSFDRQDYWRGQFKGLLDAATDAGIQANKVGSSLALDTGTGHIAAVNAIQKMIDQGAVVRDQDVALIQSAQSFLEQNKAAIEQLKSGRLLSPKLQQEMTDLAASLERAIYDGTLARINPYQDTMKTEGVDIRQIVPDALYSRLAPPMVGNFTMGAAPGLPNSIASGQSITPIGQSFRIAGGTATRIK